MAEKKLSRKTSSKPEKGFSAEERAAMRERAQELRAQRGGREADGEADVRAKIREMDGSDRALAERFHAIVRAQAPSLTPRTWYGMPAYARDGEVLCWFQPAQKFKSRYATIGFSDGATLDDGRMWPVMYAIVQLTDVEEARVAALVKQALR